MKTRLIKPIKTSECKGRLGLNGSQRKLTFDLRVLRGLNGDTFNEKKLKP